MNQNASGDIDRAPCPTCKELIAVDAVKCPPTANSVADAYPTAPT
jgi:hypothetical protein